MSDNKSLNLDSFYAQKAGMTRIFDAQGKNIPVTVIKLIPNLITQVKTSEKDGYGAYKIGYYVKRESLLTKPVKGQLVKAGVAENVTKFYEVKVENSDVATLGAKVGYDSFTKDTYIDVTSTSKGKGFQGVVKRYNFAGGPQSHGSHFHRRPGSIGNRATPARVFAGKKMPGQMGNKTVTTQNLKVVEINLADGYMLVKGSVPGHKNSFVKISKAFKK
jgi:large subunit ribosomal protein L3